MNNKLNKAERAYLAMVKSLPCGVCGVEGRTEAHHIIQHRQYLCVPLCDDCHRGSNGIHGDKSYFRIKKITEWDVLNDTINKLMTGNRRI